MYSTDMIYVYRWKEDLDLLIRLLQVAEYHMFWKLSAMEDVLDLEVSEKENNAIS